MAYTVTEKSILSVRADAAVICIENKMRISDSAVCRELGEAGGETFRKVLEVQKFLPVGSARAAGTGIGPFRQIILAASPRWENAQGNEILILQRCYRNVFQTAERLGCKTIAMPFLSAFYYRFPKEDAVRTAQLEANRTGLQVIFTAENEELAGLGRKECGKQSIRSYIGYYRDYAVFELENGQYVRVDIRPENRDAARILYFEPCYRVGHDPAQEPLPEKEIERLRTVYEEYEF